MSGGGKQASKERERERERKLKKERGKGNDLDNGNAEEVTAKANSNGSSCHDSWACKESYGHGKSCNGISTCYDPWLQSHEQTCH